MISRSGLDVGEFDECISARCGLECIVGHLLHGARDAEERQDGLHLCGAQDKISDWMEQKEREGIEAELVAGPDNRNGIEPGPEAHRGDHHASYHVAHCVGVEYAGPLRDV